MLEIDHVVAAQHGRAAVEETITEAKTGFDQDVPRLGPADAVDPESTQVLERLDGGPGAVAEEPVGVDRRATVRMAVNRRWTSGHGSPLVSEGERQAYRYAAISWRS